MFNSMNENGILIYTFNSAQRKKSFDNFRLSQKSICRQMEPSRENMKANAKYEKLTSIVGSFLLLILRK